jgi:hypothetical protein
MGLLPTEGDEKRRVLWQLPFLYSDPFLFVIPSAYPDFLPHSSHRAAYVVLLKENHMQLFEAATLDRKSGEARNLLCAIRVPQI